MVPWGLLDVLLAIGLLFIFSTMAVGIVDQCFGATTGKPPVERALSYHRWKTAALALGSLSTLLVSAAIIMLRCRVTLRDLGFVPGKVWHDIRLGATAFLALAPPVYALQFLLVELVAKSKHPLVETLREHPDPTLIAVSIVSAVIIAPVFEEYVFRGLLQGWLEKLVRYTGDPTDLFLGGAQQMQQVPGSGDDDESGADSLRVAADRDNPYALSSKADSSAGRLPLGFADYLPILASAILFAAMHMAHGPDWLPLFFLALGLGYLYRQTHRLLPCIVVHFLLNSCSMGMFLIELLNPR
jgi:membrane protease YdiL (CAAX protease family)